MSREDYVELVQDLCEELGLADASEFLGRGLLRVDDTLIAIEYIEERDEIRLLADLDEFEEGVDRGEMLQLLLELNLGNAGFYLPAFSLHPESDHPVLAHHIPLPVLLEEDVDLAFVLTERLVPLLDDSKLRLREALDSKSSSAGPLPLPGSLV
ncbi:hypothetical protein H6CHR_00257 [Variovorax sp. PBL-H6]|uniref:CesT family type III secretion system chaperone n=1 Tax=Variovorax sp. PBL-H6 TaxID=434009 RepID=UPI001317ABC1|nr:CesT family type III secretion system chaperone [Variovorax sp. PBL-H6]VTU15518.1 hypothetical protein H6CHR_00257 [Variovorax sp. PBL-H6]